MTTKIEIKFPNYKVCSKGLQDLADHRNLTSLSNGDLNYIARYVCDRLDDNGVDACGAGGYYTFYCGDKKVFYLKSKLAVWLNGRSFFIYFKKRPKELWTDDLRVLTYKVHLEFLYQEDLVEYNLRF